MFLGSFYNDSFLWGHPWNGMQGHMLLRTPGTEAGVTVEQMLVYQVKGLLLPWHQPIQRSRTHIGSMAIQYLNKEHCLGFPLKRFDIPFSRDLRGPCGAFNWEQVNISLVAGEFGRWNETEAVTAGGLTAAAKYLSIFLPFRRKKRRSWKEGDFQCRKCWRNRENDVLPFTCKK